MLVAQLLVTPCTPAHLPSQFSPAADLDAWQVEKGFPSFSSSRSRQLQRCLQESAPKAPSPLLAAQHISCFRKHPQAQLCPIAAQQAEDDFAHKNPHGNTTAQLTKSCLREAVSHSRQRSTIANRQAERQTYPQPTNSNCSSTTKGSRHW